MKAAVHLDDALRRKVLALLNDESKGTICFRRARSDGGSEFLLARRSTGPGRRATSNQKDGPWVMSTPAQRCLLRRVLARIDPSALSRANLLEHERRIGVIEHLANLVPRWERAEVSPGRRLAVPTMTVVDETGTSIMHAGIDRTGALPTGASALTPAMAALLTDRDVIHAFGFSAVDVRVVVGTAPRFIVTTDGASDTLGLMRSFTNLRARVDETIARVES